MRPKTRALHELPYTEMIKSWTISVDSPQVYIEPNQLSGYDTVVCSFVKH